MKLSKASADGKIVCDDPVAVPDILGTICQALALLLALALFAECGAAPALGAERAPTEGSEPAVHAAQNPESQDFILLAPTRPVLVRLSIRIDGKPFRQAWQQRFDQLFAEHDKANVGTLTPDDAAAVCREMTGSAGAAPGMDSVPLLKSHSSGADQRIAKDALRDVVQRIAPPVSLQTGAVSGRGGSALFSLLDVNGDGRLSAEELRAAPLRVRSRDFADDGLITAQNLILDPKAIAKNDDVIDGATATPSSVVLIEAETTSESVAQALLRRYDRNHDARLSTAGKEPEVLLRAAVMEALHATSTDLTAEELGRFAQRTPDVELKFALGKGSGSVTMPRVADSEFRVRKKLDGGYKLDLGDVQIDFRRNNRNPAEIVADRLQFEDYDADKNGYLDESEVKSNALLAGAFKAMDKDGDGKITKAEFDDYIDRQNAAGAARLVLDVTDHGQDLFTLLDVDHDGLLSPKELRAAADLLQTADKNGDGFLDGSEIPLQLSLELSRGAGLVNAQPRLVRARPREATLKPSTAGPAWFRKMDRNGDGELDPGEFLGPREVFDKLDANHDGVIDADEAQAAATLFSHGLSSAGK